MDVLTNNVRSESSIATSLPSSTDSRTGWTSCIDSGLERGVSWLLALLLFFSIAFMGGRYDWGWLAWGELVFVSIATLATALWLVRLAIRPQLGLILAGRYCCWRLAGSSVFCSCPRCRSGLSAFVPRACRPSFLSGGMMVQ